MWRSIVPIVLGYIVLVAALTLWSLMIAGVVAGTLLIVAGVLMPLPENRPPRSDRDPHTLRRADGRN